MINIISDPRRPERASQCISHFQDRGIYLIDVWSAVYDLDTVVASINASHKKIVRSAMERNLPECIIAEDDAFFPAITGWDYYQSRKPVDYDLYLGGVYGTELPPGNPLKQFVGLHFYTINSSWYDRFLAVPDNVHIDTAQTGGNFIACYPFAVVQRPGWSANNQKEVDYNTGILRKWDVYHDQ